MKKNEFGEYLKYLVNLFNMQPITNPQVIETWYKYFENTNTIIAREMAERYAREEKRNFNIARLLEYKPIVVNGRITYKEAPKCEHCKGTGYVFFEINEKGRLYDMGRRCICDIGNRLSKDVRQLQYSDLEGRYRDYNGVYRLNEIKDQPMAPAYIQQMKDKYGQQQG